MGLTGQQNDSNTTSDFESVGEAPVAEAPTKGGRKRRRSRKKGRKSRKGKKSKKSKKSRKGSRKTRKKGKRKRPLNAYFKMMLAAKKAGSASFKYKGKTYKGRKHGRLGMIYKKA